MQSHTRRIDPQIVLAREMFPRNSPPPYRNMIDQLDDKSGRQEQHHACVNGKESFPVIPKMPGKSENDTSG
ncbi:MAG: hypothetical protein LKE16_07600 [Dialister sp.]|nr:hypothetical protein [Dialister sp.]